MCYPTLILFQSLFLSLFLFLSVNLYAHHLAKNVLIRIDKHGKISELSDQDNRMSRTTATVRFFRAGTWQASAEPADIEFVSVAS